MQELRWWITSNLKTLDFMVNVNHFEKEAICIYKGETYSVRDNGSVSRHPIAGKRNRPNDSKWTFGKLNPKTGYMEIASVVIHRIVARAFNGEPPTNEHVVDHIDTNKQNNRPENLRWLTRLENILLNPITARRIEIVCGSVEAFLADPSKFKGKFPDPNYDWMCAVSSQEAQLSKKRLLEWAKSGKSVQGGTLGAWIYSRGVSSNNTHYVEDENRMIDSLTRNALQIAKNWKTPTEFPLCPQETSEKPLVSYAGLLTIGGVFSRNQFTSSIIECFAVSSDESTLWVMCKSGEENPIKPYSLAEVTYQKEGYVHNSLGTFIEKTGAEKQFNLVQGLDWTFGETIDDFC